MLGHDGLDWFWMTAAMTSWLVLIGAVVYVAVRLAQRHGGPAR